MPCDDIIDDIDKKYKELALNPDLVHIGYREWNNRTDIKTTTFNDFTNLIQTNDTITIDNIVYIKYIDIFLWHKSNKIDRMNGSGGTSSSQTWNKIKHRYTKHIKAAKSTIANDDDEKKDENEVKTHKITLNIIQNPAPLLGQSNTFRPRYRWSYRYHDPMPDMVENGFYEHTDVNGQKSKIKVEKTLKKSYKKSKLYHESRQFKFLTAKVLDSVYRIHENMEINIVNATSLDTVYRIHANKENKPYKKLCILNVDGENNGFSQHSTVAHSLSRFNYARSVNKSDIASKCLYTSTMVYSPNCIIYRDQNRDMMADYMKVSFITAHPVDFNEYMRLKKKIFNAPAMEKRLKELDAKLENSKCGGKKVKHVSKNKSDKQRQAENEEFMAQMAVMNERIEQIMRDRIRRMIEIAIYNGCDAVVFDAFGCNVNRGNDPMKIANIFSELMHSVYKNCFRSVTFAIKEREVYRYGHCRNDKKEEQMRKLKFKMFQEAFEQKMS